MSKASARLKDFEKLALKRMCEQSFPGFLSVEPKSIFHNTAFDGVFQNGSRVIVLEVALGGRNDELKPGPYRKILADGFKLSTAEAFLKDPSYKIEERIILVRNDLVRELIDKGWASKSFAKSGVEIISASFTPQEEDDIHKILKICIEEQSKKIEDYFELDTEEEDELK